VKTYTQLTSAQQSQAVEKCLLLLLDDVVEGRIRFNDNLQSRIDAAIQEANYCQTPWFAGECVMEEVGKELWDMARCRAENALYAEPNEDIILGV